MKTLNLPDDPTEVDIKKAAADLAHWALRHGYIVTMERKAELSVDGLGTVTRYTNIEARKSVHSLQLQTSTHST